jgi:ubiquinone/menaquinone biosynthesis C-methylase UbiE
MATNQKLIDPKEVTQRLSLDGLCESADVYYRDLEDPTQLLGKPFSSAARAPELLRNMGVLLQGLRIGKTMTVLEFAAGTCWFSRILCQMGCRVIACDVSVAALDLGRRLFEEQPLPAPPIAGPRFLHFDGRKLDLPDATVDRIVCFDAFHHVPNQEEVLAELARVLKPGGVAGFVEPGPHHSSSPEAQYEMAHHDVLENDIVLTDIAAIAMRAGFTEIRVRPLLDHELSLRDYSALTRRKWAPIVANGLNRSVRRGLDGGAIFFLHKGPLVLDSRGAAGLSHRMETTGAVATTSVGEPWCVEVKVTNTGQARWLAENVSEPGEVKLGAHLYDSKGKLLNLDFGRSRTRRDVEPGESLPWSIELRFEQPGSYLVELDLVAELITWFEMAGSAPVRIAVEVV